MADLEGSGSEFQIKVPESLVRRATQGRRAVAEAWLLAFCKSLSNGLTHQRSLKLTSTVANPKPDTLKPCELPKVVVEPLRVVGDLLESLSRYHRSLASLIFQS